MKTLSLAALALGGAVILAVPAIAQTNSSAQQGASAAQTMPPGYGPMGRGMGMGMGWGMHRGMMYGRGYCGGAGGMGGMMMGGMMMGGMMTMMRYPDGALAFLKTELKVKDSQMGKWKTFAHAARITASSMRQMWQKQWRQGWRGSLPQRLQHHEQMMAFGLESMRTVSAALIPLYNALDAGQKRTADALFMSCNAMGPGMGWRWRGKGTNQ